MNGKIDIDNRKLIHFWNEAFGMSEEDKNELRRQGPEGWRGLAPSEKLFLAAASLGKKKKVLDYGCGSAWAGIIAAKSGCPDVTAVDPAPAAAKAARFSASLYGIGDQLHVQTIAPDWLENEPAESYDGLICSNVLDVVPQETARRIIRETARIAAGGAQIIIGLNYYLSPEAAHERGINLEEDGSLYLDGVLRLVSRTDEDWAALFAPYYSVESLEHFAWPGEKAETRRLFRMRKCG